MKHPAFAHLVVGIALCLPIAIAAMTSTTVLAHTNQPPIFIKQHTSSQSVTILVLDMSGSMYTNDPDGLRCSAADAFIDLSGPGNFIGVVGLDNNNGARGGPHNFQLAQQWAQPMEMATLAERQQLQNIIVTRSNHCRPDNTTPTYGALSQALQMLTTATNNGQIAGSVVLLTDGVPDPNTIDQMNAIRTDLLPQFKQHGWPIDTIALGVDGPVQGTNTTFHKFLGGLSDATSGNFYDDGHGIAPGVSPLNIADFFVDIFAQRNHRTVRNDIPPTMLSGGITNKQNFSVTDYTNNLDIVVVKDKADTNASLITPNGQVISGSGSGVFVSQSDPHYEIFSISQPQSGQWELDVTGSGQFLMDSLKESGIGLSSLSVSQQNLVASSNSALALGQPLTIVAGLTYNGQPITDNRFTLTGTITYHGAAGQYNQSFTLDDKNTPGTYTGSITIPSTAPPGTYKIVVNASTVSLEAVVASQDRSVRIELFPVPVLATSQANPVVQWDPALRAIYGIPFGPITKLGAWALDNIPAQPSANIPGQVLLQQQTYSDVTVTAVVISAASHTTIPATIVNDGGGRFHLQFVPSGNGHYTILFKTSGTFAQSHGDFGTTQQLVNITGVPATRLQEAHAWAFTVMYLLFLVFLILLVRFYTLPKPQGEWVCKQDGNNIGRFDFGGAHRGLRQWFFRRNLLYSRQAKMPRGLLFHFRRGAIEVRPDGSGGTDWQRASDETALPRTFSEVYELRYRPKQAGGARSEIDEDEDAGAHDYVSNSRSFRTEERDDPVTYYISAGNKKASFDRDWEDDGFEEEKVKPQKQRPRRKVKQNEQKKSYEWEEDYE